MGIDGGAATERGEMGGESGRVEAGRIGGCKRDGGKEWAAGRRVWRRYREEDNEGEGARGGHAKGLGERSRKKVGAKERGRE